MEDVKCYFKGTQKGTGCIVFGIIYNEMQTDLFDEKYIVELSCLQQTGLKYFETIEECEEKYYLSRVIKETEYKLYRDIQLLATEFYLNQFSGGFPREKTVKSIANNMRRDVINAFDDIREE